MPTAAKIAYKQSILTHTATMANRIHQFRQENRNPDGRRLSYWDSAILVWQEMSKEQNNGLDEQIEIIENEKEVVA